MQNEKKITLLNLKGDINEKILPLGTILVLEKNETKTNSSILTNVNGDYIYVSSSPSTTLTNFSLENLIEFMGKDTSIKCEIVGYDKISFKNGKEAKVAIAEIQEKNKSEKGEIKMMKETFNLEIKGNNIKYQGKRMILEDFNKGEEPLIKLKINENNEIIAYYKDIEAGIVKDITEEDLIFIKSKPEVFGLVTETLGVTPIVSIEKEVEVKVQKTVVKQDWMCPLIDKGFDKQTLSIVNQYLKNCNVKKAVIDMVFKTYKYNEKTKNLIPKIESLNELYIDKKSFGGINKSLIYLLKNKHLRFVGEKGVGKNEMLKSLAFVLQRPLYEMSLSNQTDKSDLLGDKVISSEETAVGIKQSITFQEEALIKAMNNGGIICLDEANTVSEGVLVQIHSAIDKRRTMEVAGFGKVVATENFSVIMTMNPSHYEGTNNMNEATKDRFVPIVFPTNESILTLLKSKYPEIELDVLTTVNEIYKEIKSLVDNEALSTEAITVRGYLDALDAYPLLDLNVSLIDNIANRVTEQEEIDMISEIIDNKI